MDGEGVEKPIYGMRGVWLMQGKKIDLIIRLFIDCNIVLSIPGEFWEKL